VRELLVDGEQVLAPRRRRQSRNSRDCRMPSFVRRPRGRSILALCESSHRRHTPEKSFAISSALCSSSGSQNSGGGLPRDLRQARLGGHDFAQPVDVADDASSRHHGYAALTVYHARVFVVHRESNGVLL